MANLFSRTSMPGGMWGRSAFGTTLALLWLGLAAGALLGPVDEAAAQNRLLAPELSGGAGWLGSDQPLSLKALRGKIVILEFWTGC